MLVLSRHKNEAIVIDHNIVVTVVEIRGDEVRLGVEAPRDIPVHRQEVEDAVNREQQAASRKALETATWDTKPEPGNG